ncbi:MAG: hypothetical protein AB7J19_06965 [Beijerinckiaceae bacterium]
METRQYDRTSQDLGNIVEIGHINYLIPDQRLATLFYVSGLGLTRDPIMMTSVDNMCVNAGKSQFHLPTGDAVVAPCTRTALVIPGRQSLLERLAKVKKDLAGTKFDYRETNDAVEATCPWGNAFIVHEPDPERYGNMRIGMPYVEFETPHGTADRIARYYREIFETPARAGSDESGAHARVEAGPGQFLLFRETGKENVINPTHHVQIYLRDFSGPYRRLLERDLVSEESSEVQYRTERIVDLDTGELLFLIDHEVRAMRHPMFGRYLVNRNPDQFIRNYKMGHDEAQIYLA